jgi:hypothetical protein
MRVGAGGAVVDEGAADSQVEANATVSTKPTSAPPQISAMPSKMV